MLVLDLDLSTLSNLEHAPTAASRKAAIGYDYLLSCFWPQAETSGWVGNNLIFSSSDWVKNIKWVWYPARTRML
jgi:hypothetical protein